MNFFKIYVLVKVIIFNIVNIFINNISFLDNNIGYNMEFISGSNISNSDNYIGISSSTSLKNGVTYLNKVGVDTKVKELYNFIKTSGIVQIKNKDNELLSNDDIVGTGTKVNIKLNDDSSKEYIAVVPGDINGNGIIEVSDISMAYAYVKNKINVDNSSLYAIDYNMDDKQSSDDVDKIYKFVKDDYIEEQEVFINVLEYGAKGDGVYDNTSILSNIINKYSDDQILTLFFPNGTYVINEMIINKNNVNILGTSPSGTILKSNSSKYLFSVGMDSKKVNNVNISNLTIRSYKDCDTNTYINLYNVGNIYINNIWLYKYSKGHIGINIKNSSNVSLMNIQEQSLDYGIVIDNSDNILIENSRFDGNKVKGLVLNNSNNVSISTTTLWGNNLGTDIKNSSKLLFSNFVSDSSVNNNLIISDSNNIKISNSWFSVTDKADCISLSKCNDISFANTLISMGMNNGLYADDCSNLEITMSTLFDSGRNGSDDSYQIVLNNSKNVFINSNIFRFNDYTDSLKQGIFINNNSSNYIIKNNDLSKCKSGVEIIDLVNDQESIIKNNINN